MKVAKSKFRLLTFTLAGLILTAVFIFVIHLHTDNKKQVTDVKKKITVSQTICFSTYDVDGKSSIYCFYTKNGEYKRIIGNRDVMLSGNLSKDGKWLVYTDALEDKPWQGYLMNLNTKKTYQFTNSNYGKINFKFGSNSKDIIYGIEGTPNGLSTKIYRIDVKNLKAVILDEKNKDRQVQCFDTLNDKVIAVTYSAKEEQRAARNENIDNHKINYSIFEMDTSGINIKLISRIKAYSIDGISFAFNGDSAIIGGVGINKSEGYYKLDLKSGEIKSLLIKSEILKSGEILKFQPPYSAFFSSNNNKIYFCAVYKNAKRKLFGDIQSYPSSLFSYDIKNNKIIKLTNLNNLFIANMSSTYN